MEQPDTTLQRSPEIQMCHKLLLDPDVAVAFDFDGTMATTDSYHRQSVEMALSRMGISIKIEPDFGATYLRGKSNREVMETVLEHFAGIRNDEVFLEHALKLRDEALLHLIKGSSDLSAMLNPGIDDLVRILRRTHQRVAIATLCSEGFVGAFLRRVEVDGRCITDVFDPRLIIGANTIAQAEARDTSTGAHRKRTSLAKPHTFSVFYGARKLHRNPRQVLYIGDSEVDAQTAAADPRIIALIVVSDSVKRENLKEKFKGHSNITFIASLQELVY